MFSAISIKIPMALSIEMEKSVLKFTWKHKRPLIAKTILSKKSNAGARMWSNGRLPVYQV
jgi:hypothetical protein